VEQPILELSKVGRFFGGLAAVSNLSFTIREGQLKAIIGPNGSGKTTVFNVISMVYPPQQGIVKFRGKKINNLRPHMIASLGIARTFQNIRLFSQGLTVIENVIAGQFANFGIGTFDIVMRGARAREEYRRCEDRAMRWLEYVGLSSKAFLEIDSLTFAERRTLELARALASEAELLLLDEPAAGLIEVEAQEFSKRLRQVNSELKKTICLIEHHVKLVMDTADEILVMNFGQRLAEGPPDEIKNNEDVIKVYFGEEEDLA
jgi:branched-chain amino acid transport system ATP-binding protein